VGNIRINTPASPPSCSGGNDEVGQGITKSGSKKAACKKVTSVKILWFNVFGLAHLPGIMPV